MVATTTSAMRKPAPAGYCALMKPEAPAANGGKIVFDSYDPLLYGIHHPRRSKDGGGSTTIPERLGASSDSNDNKVEVAATPPRKACNGCDHSNGSSGTMDQKKKDIKYIISDNEDDGSSSSDTTAWSPAQSIVLPITADPWGVLAAARGGGLEQQQQQQQQQQVISSKEALMLRYMEEKLGGHDRQVSIATTFQSPARQEEHHPHHHYRHGGGNSSPPSPSPPYPFQQCPTGDMTDSAYFAAMELQAGIVLEEEEADDAPFEARGGGATAEAAGAKGDAEDRDDTPGVAAGELEEEGWMQANELEQEQEQGVRSGDESMMNAASSSWCSLSVHSDEMSSIDGECGGEGGVDLGSEAKDSLSLLWRSYEVDTDRFEKFREQAEEMKRVSKAMAHDGKAAIERRQKQMRVVESLDAVIVQQEQDINGYKADKKALQKKKYRLRVALEEEKNRHHQTFETMMKVQVDLQEDLDKCKASKTNMEKAFQEKEAGEIAATSALTAAKVALELERDDLRAEVARLRLKLTEQKTAAVSPSVNVSNVEAPFDDAGGQPHENIGGAKLIQPPSAFAANLTVEAEPAQSIVSAAPTSATPVAEAAGGDTPGAAQSCGVSIAAAVGTAAPIPADGNAAAAVAVATSAEPSDTVVTPPRPESAVVSEVSGGDALAVVQLCDPPIDFSDNSVFAAVATVDLSAATDASPPVQMGGFSELTREHPDAVNIADAAARLCEAAAGSTPVELTLPPVIVEEVVLDIPASAGVVSVSPAAAIATSTEVAPTLARVIEKTQREPAVSQMTSPVAAARHASTSAAAAKTPKEGAAGLASRDLPPVAIAAASSGADSLDTSADPAFDGRARMDTLSSGPAGVPLYTSAAGDAAAGLGSLAASTAHFARATAISAIKESRTPTRARVASAEMERSRFGFKSAVSITSQDVQSAASTLRATPGKDGSGGAFATSLKTTPKTAKRSPVACVPDDTEEGLYFGLFSPAMDRDLSVAYGTPRCRRAFRRVDGSSSPRPAAVGKEERSPTGPIETTIRSDAATASTGGTTTAASAAVTFPAITPAIAVASPGATFARLSASGGARTRTASAKGSHSTLPRARPTGRAMKTSVQDGRRCSEHITGAAAATATAATSATGAAAAADVSGSHGDGSISNARRRKGKDKEAASQPSGRILRSALRAGAGKVPPPPTPARATRQKKPAAPAEPARVTRSSTRRLAAGKTDGRDVMQRKPFMSF